MCHLLYQCLLHGGRACSHKHLFWSFSYFQTLLQRDKMELRKLWCSILMFLLLIVRRNGKERFWHSICVINLPSFHFLCLLLVKRVLWAKIYEWIFAISCRLGIMTDWWNLVNCKSFVCLREKVYRKMEISETSHNLD